MASGVSIDASEVRALAADMRAVDGRLTRWIRPALDRGAIQIRNQLRDEMRSSTHFKGAAGAISYDWIEGSGDLEVEIGPSSEDGSPGNLANIAYFGTSRGGGTVPDPELALQAEAPKFEKALADLLEDLL